MGKENPPLFSFHGSEIKELLSSRFVLNFQAQKKHRINEEEAFMNPSLTPVFELSLSEKLQLVEDLWDDIAAVPVDVPVRDWQKEELDRRKANFLSNPGSGLSWEEVQRRIRKRYGR